MRINSSIRSSWLVAKTPLKYLLRVEKQTPQISLTVIMPSKYTDEIENSSCTRRAFSMGRKSKYSAKEKLLILREVSQYGI
ncbi:hypothetical protein ON001_09385, partial [Limosilactobacillus oris]|nr:hypothetical protein [Limosilactobacillus oris]